MKLFKKYFLSITLLLLGFALAFAFAACGNKEKDGPTPVGDTRVLWGTLSGVVTDYGSSPVDPSPVSGVTVKSGDETATTDEHGYYSIKVYDNGATVSFEKAGRFTQSKTFKSSSFRSDVATYDFVMYACAKVQGSVKDNSGNAVSGVTVEIGIQTTTTDAQGEFEFAEVIATTMIVKATYNGKTVIKPVYTEQMLGGTVTVEIVLG